MKHRLRPLFAGKPYVPAFDAPANPLDQPWTVEAFMLAVFLVALVSGMFMVYDAQADDPNAAELERVASAERTELAQRAGLARAYERGLGDGVRATKVAPEGNALVQACRVAGLADTAHGVQP